MGGHQDAEEIEGTCRTNPQLLLGIADRFVTLSSQGLRLWQVKRLVQTAHYVTSSRDH